MGFVVDHRSEVKYAIDYATEAADEAAEEGGWCVYTQIRASSVTHRSRNT